MRFSLPALLAPLVCFGVLFEPAAAVQAEVGSTPDAGAALYVTQGCYQCHGLAGQGSPMSGPALVPGRLDDAALRAYVRAPRGTMPRYSANILPEDDLEEIIGYVRRLDPGRPPASIPLLAPFVTKPLLGATTKPRPEMARLAAEKPTTSRPKAAAPKPAPAGKAAADDIGAGRRLFQTSCAACHGANRTGGMAPGLRGEAAKRSLAGTIALILAPPPGMPRLSPRPLSAAQVKQVALYVRQN